MSDRTSIEIDARPVKPDEAQAAAVQNALSRALGHLRNATVSLLGADDQAGEGLLLGIAGFELQAVFGDVWPAYIADELTPAEALDEAERILGAVIDHIPLGLWVALRSLREQVDDGHR